MPSGVPSGVWRDEAFKGHFEGEDFIPGPGEWGVAGPAGAVLADCDLAGGQRVVLLCLLLIHGIYVMRAFSAACGQT